MRKTFSNDIFAVKRKCKVEILQLKDKMINVKKNARENIRHAIEYTNRQKKKAKTVLEQAHGIMQVCKDDVGTVKKAAYKQQREAREKLRCICLDI